MDSRKISEMRNLGPACEKALNSAGIHTAQDVLRLGVEETFERMVAKQISTKKRYVIHSAYLYAIYGAIEDCAWQDVPVQKKIEFKAIAARLRKKYQS